MKTFLNFLFVLFIISVLSSGCEKEDPIVPEGITVEDLVGNWGFVSLEVVGVKTYYAIDAFDMQELNEAYNYGALSFKNVSHTEIGVLDHFGSLTPLMREYELLNNKITILNNINGTDWFVFNIENVESFNGTVLELKLESTIGITNAPINGIYILSK